jgi:hypothetical protein
MENLRKDNQLALARHAGPLLRSGFPLATGLLVHCIFLAGLLLGYC